MLKTSKAFKVLIATLAIVGTVSVASAADFGTTTLKVGSKGAAVTALQNYLGVTPVTGYFGPITKAKVMAWQASNGLTADGIFGAASKAKANATVGTPSTGCPAGALFNPTTGAPCATTTTVSGCTAGALFSSTTGQPCGTTTVGTVTGGAGSISDVKKDSSYSSQQVTQGATDSKVVAFTVKADSGSDLAIQTLSLDLKNTGTGSTTLTRYMNSVSVWEGNTKVATVSAADFTKSGTTYSKNIPLTGAVVKAGQTEEFYVTVNANTVIDSADLGVNTWTAVVQSVRFVDGTGAIMTDSTTGDLPYTQTFSFVTLATAGEKELKVSLTTGQDAVNKAHVVTVSTTSTTNDVPLLAFDIKATGTINHITSIPVTIASVTRTVAQEATTFSLWKDGVKIDTKDVSEGSASGCTATSCVITFDDEDFNIADGVTSHFVVKANIKKISAPFAEGDSLTASITSAQADAIVAEDVNANSFAAGDITGSAAAEKVTFNSKGVSATLVSTNATVAKGLLGSPDLGTYTITFDVTAFGSDIYVDKTAPNTAGTNASTVSIVGAAGTLTAVITSPTGATEGTDGFLVAEGTTQRFTITAVVTPTAGGLSAVKLASLDYATTDKDGDLAYTTNLTNFVTPYQNLVKTN